MFLDVAFVVDEAVSSTDFSFWKPRLQNTKHGSATARNYEPRSWASRINN